MGEEAAGSPLTETEVEASRRPPSTGEDEQEAEQPRREQEQAQPD
jgi:hypothetical protein